MPHLRSVILAQGILLGGLLIACSQPSENAKPTPAPGNQATEMSEMPGMAASGAEERSSAGPEGTDAQHIYEGGAHRDHHSKHGGTFFMGLDNRHHLEGTLDPPGVFRVYVYDAYTKPVSAEELGEVQAKVIWGEQDGAPEIELKPNAEGTVLEAEAPDPIHFPLTLTLLCRFPGEAPTSRPELFTFPFSHYSHIDTTPHEHPVGQ